MTRFEIVDDAGHVKVFDVHRVNRDIADLAIIRFSLAMVCLSKACPSLSIEISYKFAKLTDVFLHILKNQIAAIRRPSGRKSECAVMNETVGKDGAFSREKWEGRSKSLLGTRASEAAGQDYGNPWES